MSNIVFSRILAAAAVSLALAGAPQASVAQRGGFHGGGGGFHGGGSGFHGGGFRGGSSGFHGGTGFGSFRGGNFGGFRGGRGFNGFRGGRFYGGFRGYRGYYPGFYSGFGFGFGFWPYWGGYPYYGYYGYSPWWAPGPYAYYSPYDYGDYPDRGYSEPGCDSGSRDRGYGDGCAPDNRNRRDNRDCYDYRQKCAPDNRPNKDNAPAKPSSEAAPESSPAGTYLTVSYTTANVSEVPDKATPGLRPAVRNAIAALRAMPPAARERQLNSGRYASFSPEERERLTNASQRPLAETVN